MKNKVLYITPHLSTGGMPKFLLKQIESIYKFFSIYVIEYENLGGDSYIAHKNKILPLLDGIFTLKGNNTIINAENSPETCSAIFLGTKFEDNKITQIGNIIGASNILISDIVFALLKLKNKDFVDIITISLKL